jgi:DNA polymerase-3 subunit delta'
VLIAESTTALLPTVVSRCQLLRFSLIPTAAIEQVLVDRFSLPRGRARFLAALADGRLGRAVTWATSGEPLQLRDSVLDLLERIAHADPLERLDAAESLAKDKATLPEVLEIALFWYRDLIVWQETANESMLINLDRKEAIAARAREISPAVLSQWIEAVDDAKDAVRRNVHPRLALETLFLHLSAPPTPASR